MILEYHEFTALSGVDLVMYVLGRLLYLERALLVKVLWLCSILKVLVWKYNTALKIENSNSAFLWVSQNLNP